MLIWARDSDNVEALLLITVYAVETCVVSTNSFICSKTIKKNYVNRQQNNSTFSHWNDTSPHITSKCSSSCTIPCPFNILSKKKILPFQLFGVRTSILPVTRETHKHFNRIVRVILLFLFSFETQTMISRLSLSVSLQNHSSQWQWKAFNMNHGYGVVYQMQY